jgi:8-oxo-dGTP pyrophosphatase MutT (NUDIX family)
MEQKYEKKYEKISENYCNNCGKQGHMYHQCKMPIISIGTIVFRQNENQADLQFLMIRRKHTLGFMDFMRGKYSIYNKEYIVNLLKEMTITEKKMILENDFPFLWKHLWNSNISQQYKQEEHISEEKFLSLKTGVLIQNHFYSLNTMISEVSNEEQWEEPEWGFPKGRRNYFEKDYECALREFAEETGYDKNSLKNIDNILPFEEIFTGSNYKSYKHKYYLLQMKDSPPPKVISPFDNSEVSKVEWKTYEQCMETIRPYNLEKKRLLTNIYKCLKQYKLTVSLDN